MWLRGHSSAREEMLTSAWSCIAQQFWIVQYVTQILSNCLKCPETLKPMGHGTSGQATHFAMVQSYLFQFPSLNLNTVFEKFPNLKPTT
jgi:hypothetical protein